MTRHPLYHAHIGHRLSSAQRSEKRGRASFLAAGVLTLLFIIGGAVFLKIFSVRCAVDEAARPPAQDREQAEYG